MKENPIDKRLREENQQYLTLCKEFIRLLGKLPNPNMFDLSTAYERRIKSRRISGFNFEEFEFDESLEYRSTQIGSLDIRIVKTYSGLVTKNNPSPLLSCNSPTFTLKLSERRMPIVGTFAELYNPAPFYDALKNLFYKEQ